MGNESTWLDDRANESVEWLDRASTKVAQGVMSGKVPKGVHKMSSDDKRDYWSGLPLSEKARLWPKLSKDEKEALGGV